MIKEKVKTLILIVLTINSIQLTAQIWLDEKLWPSGYNFFNVQKNKIVELFGGGNEVSGADISDGADNPRKVVINGGGAREIYDYENPLYEEVLGKSEDVFKKFFNQMPEFVSISEETWFSYFKGKSIYIDFGYPMDISMLAGYFDCTSQFSEKKIADSFLIVPESASNSVFVCFNEYNNPQSYVKCSVNYQSAELLKYIEGLTFGKQSVDAFAFELNLDKEINSEMFRKKALMYPLVVVPMDQAMRKMVEIQKKMPDAQSASRLSGGIVSALGYNIGSFRKTVTEKGVITLVENDATITISPDSVVSFNSTVSNKGILLKDSTTSGAVGKVLKIADEILKLTESENIRLHLSSELSSSKPSSYEIKMDYTCGGIAVHTDETIVNNALYAKIENGYITKFSMVILSADNITEEEEVKGTAFLEALDNYFVNKNTEETVVIKDMYECYYLSPKDETTVSWFAELKDDNNSRLIIK